MQDKGGLQIGLTEGQAAQSAVVEWSLARSLDKELVETRSGPHPQYLYQVQGESGQRGALSKRSSAKRKYTI